MKNINKRPKLRHFQCVVCGSDFSRHLSPADIKSGRGKVCCHWCKHFLNGLVKETGEYRKCVRCGEKFWAKPSEDRRGVVRKYCSRKCYLPTKRGKAISVDGYYVISGKKVHRIIMEEHLERKLLSTEIVHHRNENKLDNRLENLQLVTRSEHNRIHRFLTRGDERWGKNGSIATM